MSPVTPPVLQVDVEITADSARRTYIEFVLTHSSDKEMSSSQMIALNVNIQVGFIMYDFQILFREIK